MCALEDAAEGRARNAQDFRSLFLSFSFQMGLAQGFQLVQLHNDHGQIAERNGPGLKNDTLGNWTDPAAFWGSWHLVSPHDIYGYIPKI